MRRKKAPDDQWLEFFARNYRYDPSSGTFWKSVGSVADNGYVRLATKNGDRVVNINAHNLAVFLMTGRWPENPIDHINRVRHDNRWTNLRECTYSDNGFNKECRVGKSGYRGVERMKGGYRACIQHKGVRYRSAVFDTPEEAVHAYRAKAQELYGMAL